jgi:hypothetical protein
MDSARIDTRGQAACAWAGFAGIGVLFVGMLLAGYIPAPPADLGADQLAALYRDHTFPIRLGLLLMIIGCAGWAAVVSAFWVQSRAIGDGRSSLRALHLVTGAATYVFLSLFAVLLAGAAFRPERAPEVTQALHDIGWFMAFLAAVPFVTQALAAGLVVLADRGPDPVYPRWLGYAGLWVALLLAPGDILLFFHTGPFAYHGIISYWIPLFGFGGWWILLAVGVLRRARAATGAPAEAVPA